ncbi:MAG: MmgE/PrpD family protein [Actinomycetota bacterium]|nr:MmgE/PrpD family protein [Actinomycetota bacterium]
MQMTEIEKIARWVSSLEYDDIPERVLEISKHQIASVAGAIYAGARSAAGMAVTGAVKNFGGSGEFRLIPNGEMCSFETALLHNCSLSMSLDYDDYLFLGHTGHSSVLVPLILSGERKVDSKTLLTAQVAANEVSGRLGASVVLGPHNGQMWAHIHLAGASVAASKILGLDEERTANAIGIALAEPNYPLFPGFMGPDSKMLTAAIPSMTGAVSAFLSEKGMKGSKSIIEDSRGFWANFSFVPLPFMLSGFGESWVTETIAFKPYPGCAYVDAALDAVFQILNAFKEKKGRDIEPEDVSRIRVKGSLLSVAMDGISRSYSAMWELSPSCINFSIPKSIAVAILAGKLTGDEFSSGYLEGNGERIKTLASKVSLEHDPSLTFELIRAIDEAADLARLVGSIDIRSFLASRKELTKYLKSMSALSFSDIISAGRQLSRNDAVFLARLFRSLWFKAPAFSLADVRFNELKMPFGARVSLETNDGLRFEAESMIPRGAPGDPHRLDVAREKFTREATFYLGKKRAREALEVLLGIEDRSPAEAVEALCVKKRA